MSELDVIQDFYERGNVNEKYHKNAKIFFIVAITLYVPL